MSSTTSSLDLHQFFTDFQDFLAPRLDTYEQAVYLYVFRHSRLLGHDEAVIGFKSARRQIATGTGVAGRPMSETSVYTKLRSLEKKGCISLITTERSGTRLRVFLPSEIPDIVPAATTPPKLALEEIDFFTTHRQAVLVRENYRCFYCLKALTNDNWVVEHVVSRPVGDNSYRNVVAACRPCNNRKTATPADDFLRTLYREGLLSANDLKLRLSDLEQLKLGNLKPLLQ